MGLYRNLVLRPAMMRNPYSMADTGYSNRPNMIRSLRLSDESPCVTVR